MSDDPVSCPFIAWFEANKAALAAHPNEFVLVDLDRGIVAHGRSWEEFLASETSIPEADRRRCMRAHTALDPTKGREHWNRGIKAYAKGRAKTHLARAKMTKSGELTDKSALEEFTYAVECEREAAAIERHHAEHRNLDPEKSKLLFRSTDMLLAILEADEELSALLKRSDLPSDVVAALEKSHSKLREGILARSSRDDS